MSHLLARPRRNLIAALALAAACAGLAAARVQDAAPPQGLVEVPVRVAVDGRLAEDLALADFEILENGRIQQPQGLCLVKGREIVRREGPAPAARADRHFYLLFQTLDYDNKLAAAVDYLFQSVLRPGDAMTLVTPMKAYALSAEALTKKPKPVLSKEMQQILRKDIQSGSGEYRTLLAELRRIVKGIGGESRAVDEDMEQDSAGSQFGLEMNLDRYKQSLIKLEQIRLVDERRLTALATSLRAVSSRKFVYFFYQREFRPEISPQSINVMMSIYQDQPNVMSDLTDLFNLYRRESTFRLDHVKQAFADAAASFNFIFMNRESQYMFGAVLREQSEDAFQTFTEIARATGGVSDNSPDATTAFRRTVEATQDYYLLSYASDAPAGETGFRTIEVRLKGRTGAVTNRLGYFAR